jgi:hypothetical protein
MNLSGVSFDLQAFHTDPIMDEGEHVHTWTITAWWPSDPWRDGRALAHALSVVCEGLAPFGAGDMREYRKLPPDLWSGEALAEAVMGLLTPAPLRVNVSRPGFHVERWA